MHRTSTQAGRCEPAVPARANFSIREVNGHVESVWSSLTGWSPLRFVADPRLHVHGLATGLNYGQQVFEGIKAFRMPGDDGVRLFRPDRSAARFQHSAAALSLPPVPADLFLAACRAAVALNDQHVPPHATGEALYVRPLLFGSGPQLGLLAAEEATFCVYVVPTGTLHGSSPMRALVLDDFDRAAPNGVGTAKAGGNYAPTFRWTKAAKAEGYDITLHLDSARHEEIDEFSSCGFIGVIYGEGGADTDVTLVVPDSKSAIRSVTSDCALSVARSFGWSVQRRAVKYTELPSFDEVMGVGTAVVLVSIRSITRRIAPGLLSGPRVTAGAQAETVTFLPDDQLLPAPVCARLSERLKAIQMGEAEDEFGWCHDVGKQDCTWDSLLEK